MTPLPHSTVLNAALAKLVSSATRAKTAGVKSFASAPQLKHLYRICNATDAVLGALNDTRMRPSLHGARSIVLNQPILLLYSFVDEAVVDLRRFVELVMWNVYFSDHPVEWKEFLKDSGFSRDLERPIEFCAHRELGFYVSYSKELMAGEPSGAASGAVAELQTAVRLTNKYAHGSGLASLASRPNVLAERTTDEARALCEMANQVFANSVLVLCAMHRSRFDRFSAVTRAYFDYLVGGPVAKKIRSGQFGLAR